MTVEITIEIFYGKYKHSYHDLVIRKENATRRIAIDEEQAVSIIDAFFLQYNAPDDSETIPTTIYK